VLTLFSFLFQGNALAISIVYTGFECLSVIDENDTTPKDTVVQSKFEVIEDVGEGIYRLSLTGGIPRFVNKDAININDSVCIDSATAIGYSGIPEVDVLPKPLESINATAYFSGQDLVIVISSIYTDLSARRNPSTSFSTSLIFPFTNTLIFKFNPQASSFNLMKIIHNRGFTQTNGATNSTIPFQETVLPSFNEVVQDKPKILTPTSNIEYILE
jgi:hypothetical protein